MHETFQGCAGLNTKRSMLVKHTPPMLLYYFLLFDGAAQNCSASWITISAEFKS